MSKPAKFAEVAALPEKKALRKKQILEQAALLFMRQGYQASSMRNLAATLQMEAPSLYHHIGSKQELLRLICFEVAEMFMAHLQAVEQRQAGAAQKIEALVRFHLRQMTTHQAAVYVSNRDWKHLEALYLAEFLATRRQYEARFAALVEQGIAQGSLRPLEPRAVVLTLLSGIRAMEFWQKHPAGTDPESFENQVVALLIHGLHQPPKIF
jgi:TetR/AcrR family transcriptional regulator, cholesterol catabolism regulator